MVVERAVAHDPWRVAALFDIDGTLIARNSAPLYMRHLRRTGQARRRDVARTLYYLCALQARAARHRAGARRVDGAGCAGRDEAAVRADCVGWYARRVRPYVYPGMAATVEAHRRAGHVLAILTSATRYLAEPLAADLGIDASAGHPARRARRALHRRGGPARLLRRGQDLLGGALRRPSRALTSPRATSTRTRSRTCRCSSAWGSRGWSTRTHGSPAARAASGVAGAAARARRDGPRRCGARRLSIAWREEERRMEERQRRHRGAPAGTDRTAGRAAARVVVAAACVMLAVGARSRCSPCASGPDGRTQRLAARRARPATGSLDERHARPYAASRRGARRMATIDENLRRVPPQSLEAEESVLGGILLDNAALDRVVEMLQRRRLLPRGAPQDLPRPCSRCPSGTSRST